METRISDFRSDHIEETIRGDGGINLKDLGHYLPPCTPFGLGPDHY